MTSPVLRTATLMGATITMGLSAGVFALFAHTIMPGLHQTDDRTFVAAFQQIDRAIINPWFMITAFAGALVLSLAAVIANRGTTALPWIAAAFGLYLVAVIVTVAVNVPLNDAIKAAGNPNHIDVAQVRAQFHETRWAAWNLLRVATTTVAFGLLAWALVLSGRASSQRADATHPAERADAARAAAEYPSRTRRGGPARPATGQGRWS